MKSTNIIFFFLFSIAISAQAQNWQELESTANLHFERKKYKEADSLYSLILQYERLPDSVYAKINMQIGLVNSESGKYDRAEQFFLNALQITESSQENVKLLAFPRAQHLLGGFYRRKNIYEKASFYLFNAKKIYDTKYPSLFEARAHVNNDIGVMYGYTGNYAQAIVYLEASKELSEAAQNTESTEYLGTLQSLGTVYNLQGEYTKSEAIYKKIAQKLAADTSHNYNQARVLNDYLLGLLYYRQFLFEKAFDSYEKVQNYLLKFDEQTQTPFFAQTADMLGLCAFNMKKFDVAENNYKKAIEIYKQTSGKENANISNATNNLALLYLSVKKFDKAKELFFVAKETNDKIYKTPNIYSAITIDNLGLAYQELEMYDSALFYFEKAQKIYIEQLDIKDETFAKIMFNRSYALQKLGDTEAAYLSQKEALSALKENISQNFSTMSEKERLFYFKNFEPYFNDAGLFFIENQPEGKQKHAVEFYEQALFTKAIVFSSVQKMRQKILLSGDSVLVAEFNLWKQKRETYNRLLAKPLEERQKMNVDLNGLKNQINETEREIAQKASIFSKNIEVASPSWDKVRNKLKKNEAVVEIQRLAPSVYQKSNRNDLQKVMYAVFVLTSETKMRPEILVLGNGEDLETKYLSYYKNSINFKREDKISYEQFWKPIGNKLKEMNKKGFSKIYFSPDGVYHQISLNTLQNPETGKYLLDEQAIQLIGTSRDLVEYGRNETDLSKNFAEYETYMLGFPTYNLENKKPDTTKTTDRAFSAVERIMGARGAVSILPGTKTEIENLKRMFAAKNIKTKTFLAAYASEENIKKIKNPTILHIATHGFFMPEVKETEVKTIQDAEKRNLLKNPFMRSGLLFAGCENPVLEGEDGILTAEEAMNLNLDKTELVVLSACETGLGDVQNGEGVFGLQRAFQQAGAKTVLMSLWKVSDEATQILMTEFYSALLGGKTKRDAFKIAQLKLRQKFESPYYWGAFVMVGR
jgi:CHAT domain-containing protein/tetratricopeptide (TPR) repeat protein